MKKAVMIIAQNGFRDEELLQPKKILEAEGILVKIASNSPDEARGMLGARVKPDLILQDINIGDLDAIIFVGGIGASIYWDEPLAHRIANDSYANNKIVAAICIAPVTLAKAGLLKNKKATVWPSEAGKLKSAGADYTAADVEKDGNVITASGPSAANAFGRAIAAALH